MNRAFDLPVALVGSVLTSPIVLACAIALKLDSPGPALYSGPRVGRDGNVFQIHKLRTMRAAPGRSVTAADDPRITRVGRFLRQTKLDELPQLWNVVKGEMSLVGPRPEDPKYVALYTPEQRRLLSVRPGITGPAALEFVDEEALLSGGDGEKRYVEEVMPRKLALELAYADRATLASDLGIMMRTARVIGRRGRGNPRVDA
jgi:lipopolysaccharide/colanic/teichoic acid biosynthesis glycosyltransferase